MKTILQKSQNGFTLMEVMVSVSIFAIIITIGIGSLLTINTTLQKTRAERQAIDGLSFLMDTMTRQIRTGVDWKRSSSGISFIPQAGEDGVGPGSDNRITYSFDSGQGKIYYQEERSQLRDITPAGVVIESILFTIHDMPQPYVTIDVTAEVTAGRQKSVITMQTGVSQRAIIYSDSTVNTEEGPGSGTGSGQTGSSGGTGSGSGITESPISQAP